MNVKNKKKMCKKKIKDLIILSSIIWILFLTVLITQSLNNYDKYIISSSLTLLIIFLAALLKGAEEIVDVLHMFVSFYVFLSLFSKNMYLIIIFILILTIVFFYWVRDNQCPIGNYESFECIHNWSLGHKKKITIITIFGYLILFYKLYCIHIHSETIESFTFEPTKTIELISESLDIPNLLKK